MFSDGHVQLTSLTEKSRGICFVILVVVKSLMFTLFIILSTIRLQLCSVHDTEIKYMVQQPQLLNRKWQQFIKDNSIEYATLEV